jgi:hypothetical protein
MSNKIELINQHFKLPISYNDKKMALNQSIITDLELIKTIDPSSTPLYHYAFQPKTCFGKKINEQLAQYYTTDVLFLNDTQTLLQNYKSVPNQIFRPDFDNIINIWNEIKNDTGFKEKYHYIDWPMWEYLNNSQGFLQLMSMYNLASPIISLFIPIVILIIPFFVIKMKGLSITINEYIEVLKLIASNHAIGKLFTKFDSVEITEKVYLVASALFYLFSIYQNILTCIRFHENMKKIHTFIADFRNYLEYSKLSMVNLLSFTAELKTYSEFNTDIKTHLSILVEFKEKLNTITSYKLSINKIAGLGHILKCFYELYNNETYNTSFLYSFGFNGYIDNIEGLLDNIGNKFMNYTKFIDKDLKKMKKGNKNKRDRTTIFNNSYYPALIFDNPVKNTYKFKKNLIITGPNASGKTTALKSTLINVIISQQFGLGFYDSAILEPFKFIHCYLNIPDTSGRDSLFQAECRRCKEILDIIKVNKNETHFCVFDELYSGTNPEEAVMSATAFMTYLVKKLNVTCVLTTHFIQLCKYLEENKNIENFHMLTLKNGQDGVDFKYTYKLKKGISNIKGGIKVLHDMNYPQEIIDNTSNYSNGPKLE